MHTKGKWEVVPFKSHNLDEYRIIFDLYHIASIGNYGFYDNFANAKLIAAAPALLEALEAALKTAEFENHPFRPWHDQARAAIAAAKGE